MNEKEKIIQDFKKIIEIKLPEYKNFAQSEFAYVKRQRYKNRKTSLISMPTPITKLYSKCKFPNLWTNQDFVLANYIIKKYKTI